MPFGTAFPAEWSAEGIAFFPAGRTRRHRDALRTADPRAIVLRWPELAELSAIDPWPCFRVRWHGPAGSGSDARFEPLYGAVEEALVPALAPERFAAGVQAMFTYVSRYVSEERLERGWLDAPDVAWERASGMPQRRIASARPLGHGAFREAPPPLEEEAIAVRAVPSPLESLLCWLASTPERPWRQHPREVRLSAEWIYVERRDRRIWRAPLSALRARLGETSADAAYVFGRRATVVLAHRWPPCEVREALDAMLAAQETD